MIRVFSVTMACDRVENTCFCHWVGSGPADPAGSDLLLTPVAGGWLIEAVSAKIVEKVSKATGGTLRG